MACVAGVRSRRRGPPGRAERRGSAHRGRPAGRRPRLLRRRPSRPGRRASWPGSTPPRRRREHLPRRPARATRELLGAGRQAAPIDPGTSRTRWRTTHCLPSSGCGASVRPYLTHAHGDLDRHFRHSWRAVPPVVAAPAPRRRNGDGERDRGHRARAVATASDSVVDERRRRGRQRRRRLAEAPKKSSARHAEKRPYRWRAGSNGIGRRRGAGVVRAGRTPQATGCVRGSHAGRVPSKASTASTCWSVRPMSSRPSMSRQRV